MRGSLFNTARWKKNLRSMTRFFAFVFTGVYRGCHRRIILAEAGRTENSTGDSLDMEEKKGESRDFNEVVVAERSRRPIVSTESSRESRNPSVWCTCTRACVRLRVHVHRPFGNGILLNR